MYGMGMGQPTPYMDPMTGQWVMPQMQSVQPSGMMQNNVQPQQNTMMEVIPVQTIQQVEQVQVQPGQRKMVLVQNEPVIANRTADSMGLVTTDYFSLERFDPNAIAAPVPTVNYVTPEQLEERLAAFADSLKPTRAKKGESAE